MANIFYADSDKLPKALAAGRLLDNRLSNNYLKVASDIHFDTAAYLAYFDYEKLVLLKDYTAKSIAYSSIQKKLKVNN